LFFNSCLKIAPVDVYRDGILNYTIDRNSPVHRGIFGINLHRMTNNGQVSKWVNYAESIYAPNGVAWSMGCNGAPYLRHVARPKDGADLRHSARRSFLRQTSVTPH
jgi:hypothetical protein